jgi:signal transduction histidine kinase
MATLSLRSRIFFALSLLSVATATLLGVALRTSLVRDERARFSNEFSEARIAFARSLKAEVARLGHALPPLCEHDPALDSALVGSVAGDLHRRLVSIRFRIGEERKALGFDALTLLGADGSVLGGDPISSELPLDATGSVVYSPRVDAFIASCAKSQGGVRLRLVAQQKALPLLLREAERLHLKLGWSEAKRSPFEEFSAELRLSELGERSVTVSRSKSELAQTLARIDLLTLGSVVAALLLSLIASYFLSRSAMTPVLLFSARARETVRGTAEPIPEEGGRELSAAAQAFNQTLHELEVLRQKLALSERVSARRDVAREVAHEIKNPLSPILATIETLRRLKGRDAPEFGEYFDEATSIVLSEVHRLGELVRAFSTYAALPKPEPRELDLVHFLERALVLYQEEKIAVTLATNLTTALTVADEAELSMVLSNLVKNAKEALRSSADPSILVELFHEVADEGTFLCLAVTDNGPGVPPEFRPRLFQPGATNKSGGSGIGLALSAKIAAEHGGSLRAEHPSPGGARFVLRLPQGGIRSGNA